MKRFLLFAMLSIVSALGLRAQTDVTATYLTNADFSSTDGWTEYCSSSFSSRGNGLIGTFCVTNSYTSTTDETHLSTEYCFGIQCRWQTNYTSYYQTASSATLPAGTYTITYDVENTNTSTTSATYNNLFYVKVGDTTYADTSTEWMSGSSDWTTHTISFTIDEETTADFTISLGYGTGSNNYGSGSTPHLYVSHLSITYANTVVATGIELDNSSLSLTVGGTQTLSPVFTPSNANSGTDITWSTSDASVATVSTAGVVTAAGPGSATITATTSGNLTATCSVTVTDVTSVAAPANYSEIAAGDFYIVNAATGQYLGGANSWGTQASLIEHGIPFTVAVGDGVYTLDSHTYNSTTAHYLSGTYVDGGSTNLYITALGNGKYSIATANGSAYLTANTSNTVVANTAASANSVLAQWYFVSKDNLESALANATSASPVDATFYIGDPNFSRNHIASTYTASTQTLPGGDTYPWTVIASNYNFKGGNNDNMCAESYHATFTVSQTLSVPNGLYKLRAQAAENVSSPVAVVFANDETAAFNTMANGEGSMSAVATQFTAGNYYTDWIEVYVTDGTLTVGVKSTSASNWCIWDNFELYYYGSTIGGEAEALPEGNMTADTWYYFDIAVDGSYNLTTTTLGDIVYTTDGTILMENESSVTATFSGSENVALTAGRYYVKSSSAQSLSIAAASYNYSLGDATLSVADGGYIQSSTITVTFPNAATNDPDGALALVANSTATVNNTSVSLTAVEGGFSLDLGTLTTATAYAISIPAGVYGYAGESVNTAIELTVNTPTVFDGEYVLYDAAAKLFLGRGNEYGTEASADKYGVPFNLTTDATGASSFEFVDWPNVYLFITGTSIYTDNASTGWKLVPTSGGYYLRDANLTVYAAHSAGTFGEYVHTTTNESAATVWTLKTKAERDAIIAAYPTENIENVIAATSLSTTAADFVSYLGSNFKSADCTSSIGTAIFAGSVGDWTWAGTARTQGGQPAYGTNFAEVWCATGAFTQTISGLEEGIYKLTVQGYERRKNNNDATDLYNAGYNLVSTFMSANGEQVRFTDWNDVSGKPTNVTDAVTAFNNGAAVNELYVYLDGSEDLTITVRKPNYIYDCWMIMNNFTLTRYYNSQIGGDDEEEILNELRYTVGDLTGDNKISLSDVTTLVNIVSGTTTEYNERSANINGAGDVDEADVRVLAQWLADGREPEVVDETWRYANVEATVYAEQSASENADSASYTINSAICPLTNEDVSDKVDMKEVLTTLNISVSLSDVKSVSIYAKGKENIAGVMTYNTYKKTAAYSAGETPSAYVNFDRDDVNGKNMQSDVVTVTGDNAGTYVAYLLPVSLSNGVTVTVRDNNGKFYSQDFTVTAGQENNLTFTETTATNNWMATIPGNVNFSMLSTPGAHNAATSSCGSLAKCQSETIQGLLDNGVRCFDLRPGYKYSETITAENLYIYHGIYNTEVLYVDAMATFVTFLQAHPTEAVSIIMAKEDGTPLLSSWTDYSDEMWAVMNTCHSGYSDYMKVLDHSYYTLDEFRGKICYVNRQGTSCTNTTMITNWPDATSVTDYSCAIGSTCYASVEDAYNTSGDSKKTVVNAMLDLASANTTRARFHYTFTSVANSITSSANTQNPAAATYITNTLTGPTGYVLADFMGSSSYSGQTLLKAVIEQNYKYVFKGRTRKQ